MNTESTTISAKPEATISPMVSKLDHLNLSVQDFDQSVHWYQRVFGFSRVEGGVNQGVRWGILRAGDALLCIYEHGDWQGVDTDERRERKIHGINHFGLRIRDSEAWEATLQQEGVPVLYGGPVRYPHSTSWYIEDPTGYEIEVAYWDQDQLSFG